ncbi:MAG TPA: TerC/Alx family metal homeostasis membrane protein [Kofleriaceae bacterium]|nr:TerC/Alx family metal homeostasis membrane protein [Kofleriaceae bacterium]
MPDLVVPAWAWALLAGLVVVLVSIDLFAHRGDRADSPRRAIAWSIGWIGAALGFAAWVWWQFGDVAGEQFVAAYLLEKSLSIDNLFLFVVIFAALDIPMTEQRRVLGWGIAGALISRGVFIAIGAAVLSRWHEVTYVFGAILVVAGANMLRAPTSDNRMLRWLEGRLPWTRERAGHRFLVRNKVNGRWLATPLLVALVAIELADVVFAIDSIPAAFAITEEPFIVYSSNVFAVLGLRALYIVVARALTELRYLRFGLAMVLAFAGAKMLAAPWISISPMASIAAIGAIVGTAIIASVVRR